MRRRLLSIVFCLYFGLNLQTKTSIAESCERIAKVGCPCQTDTYSGLYMERDGQLDCERCNPGQRWNPDEEKCQGCTGTLTSCTKNVSPSACHRTSCSGEEAKTDCKENATDASFTDAKSTDVKAHLKSSATAPNQLDETASVQLNTTTTKGTDEASGTTADGKISPKLGKEPEYEGTLMAYIIGSVIALLAIIIACVCKIYCARSKAKSEKDIEQPGVADVCQPLVGQENI